MNNNKLASLLGLAQKAGKLVSGETAVEQAIRKRKTDLVFLASDATINCQKNYENMAKYYSVPLYKIFSKEEMGNIIGKSPRAVVAVTDRGFCDGMVKLLQNLSDG